MCIRDRSTLLVPEISSAAALGHKGTVNRAVKHTLHITLLASILISGVFTVFAKEFGLLLYGSEEVGFYLQVLAPLTPIMYLESVVDGILTVSYTHLDVYKRQPLQHQPLFLCRKKQKFGAIIAYFAEKGSLFLAIS